MCIKIELLQCFVHKYENEQQQCFMDKNEKH